MLMHDLKEKEDKVLRYWSEHEVSEKVTAKNKSGKKFYFLDGPPYVTGELGAHHVWVETIKDLILRYKRYRGLNVHDRAGFDVHGLPIEVKVEKLLKTTSKDDIEKKIGIENFVKACRDYAKEQAKGAISTYQRFASSLDFKSVYLPYENYYISKGWWFLKEMHSKGLLYKDLEPLAYCPRCETVLSTQGPEVEYADVTDSSIFVKFKVDTTKSSKLKLQEHTYLIVWTTTPWTLPSNIAIAVNPKELYVNVRVHRDNYIVAKDRLESFASSINASPVITEEFYGSELEGTSYTSPLEKEVPIQKTFSKYHKVILSESFVNVGEGTGLLHVAPGHGPEDYKLAKQYKLPIFSPVDEHAKYTKEAGEFENLKVPHANREVLEALKKNGSLIFTGSITHSYPHCWRCNSKLIFRATEQWFINVQKLKKKMLKENQKIVWHPEVAREWFADAVQNSPDWTISRQRYWGTPIPIWICGACKHMEVIGSIRELKERAMLENEPHDLHRPHVDKITFRCKKCDGTMQRVKDVFDVWYDSGISHTASLKEHEFKKLFPADWITESRDQIRGWFTMLLRTSVAVYGKTSYKRVNIGGMIKDELGQEMHRHLGNATSASELLEIVSADGFRLWCSSHPRWLELKLKKEELQEADSNIITLYNIAELVKEFSILSKNNTRKIRKPSPSKLEKEELWILSRLNTLIVSTTKNLDNYFVDEAVKEIREFVLEDLSRFYLKFAKQRAELASKSELKKVSNLTAYILYRVLILASIVTPFTCESVYQELFSKEKESIFTSKWPKADQKYMNNDIEQEFKLFKEVSKAILNLREQKGAKLRWPIKSAIIETNNDLFVNYLQRLDPLLSMYTNAKSIKIIKGKVSKLVIKPEFAKLGPTFKNNAQLVAEELSKQNAEELASVINDTGHYILHTKNGTFDVAKEHFTVTEKAMSEKGTNLRYENSDIYVDIDTEINEELKEELVAREFIRRIQLMRKELKLTRLDSIVVYASAGTEFNKILKKNEGKIKMIVRARRILIIEKLPDGLHKKELDILGTSVKLGIKR